MDIKKQVEEVLGNFPTLHHDEVNNSLNGELFISACDSYDVRIELNGYPKHFPVVYEVGERIPKEVYRHIYSDTGSCCLTTRAKAEILLKTKITTLNLFVKDIVVPYFQNNSYYEINRKYKTEEYSHDASGVVEGYMDILQTNNERNIAQLILYHAQGNKKLRLQNICYCGSGLSFKHCNRGKHFDLYKNFRKISIETLQNDFLIFQKMIPNIIQ
ncbi:MAG: hypothetical protein N4A71_14935 [Carboxylicivirga sp.]|jgi:hypothetical protein|nr:hypothetical protein [Carboxylicivirga sp.]